MKAMDRREFSVTLGLAAAAGLVAPRVSFGAQRGTVFDWQPINDSMRVAMGGGGNVLAIASGGNTLVVDSKNPGYGKVLRDEAADFGGPVSTLINTHHHGDHSGGNPAFSADLPVYGQANGVPRTAASGEQTLAAIREDPVGRLERLQRQFNNPQSPLDASAREAGSESMADFVAMAERIDPSAFSASETFEDGAEVRIGSVNVQLRHIENAHTDNDAFVYMPDANVMHCGDLFFNGLHPYIDVGAGATTYGWQRVIDAMLEAGNADTVVIPGHGPISDPDGLRGFRGYFDTLRTVVQAGIDGGQTREQISAIEPPQFADWPDARRGANLGIVYDELTAR